MMATGRLEISRPMERTDSGARTAMKPEVQTNKVVILSGSGLSAESGLPTFRDSKGLWNNYSWQEVASLDGWKKRPEAVLAFYNERRAKAWAAEPNPAHLAIAALESAYEVVVVTQNVDELHERAGSSNVIHLHGELAYARSTSDTPKRYRIEDAAIALGQVCEEGTQLRPDIVWFGEQTQHMDLARQHIATAAKVMVVGTSLTVYPAATLVDAVRDSAEKVLISLEMDEIPYGFEFIRGNAAQAVPRLAKQWLELA